MFHTNGMMVLAHKGLLRFSEFLVILQVSFNQFHVFGASHKAGFELKKSVRTMLSYFMIWNVEE